MKAVGVLIIGLGIIMIVIGIKGTQSQVLADIKSVNPRLRTLTNTQNAQPNATGTRGKTGGSGAGGTAV